LEIADLRAVLTEYSLVFRAVDCNYEINMIPIQYYFSSSIVPSESMFVTIIPSSTFRQVCFRV